MGKLLFKALSILCAVTILVIPLDVTSVYDDEKTTAEIRNICIATSSVFRKTKDAVRIMSYNILSDGIGFEGSPCENRKSGVIDTISTLSPDILCLQEVSRGWFTIIKNHTDYTAINPTETEIAGLMTAIFFDTDTTELKAWGNEGYNTGGDYRMRRAVWGLFRIKESGKTVCVVNTHFNITKDTDTYSSVQAMELTEITDRLTRQFSCPVIIAGDFNAKKRTSVSYPSSAIYEILSSHYTDTALIAELFSAGNKKTKPTSTVDHIFLTGTAEIKRYVILSQEVFLHLSDHYPIFIDAEVD